MDWETLEERLLSILQLASEHVRHIKEYEQYWADEQDPMITLADKIIVESAMLAMVASRVGPASQEVSRAAQILARELSPYARSVRNEVLIRRYPHTAMSLGIAHAALAMAGNPDERFEALVRKALDSGAADWTERLPYRRMERHWLQCLLDQTDEINSGNDLSACLGTRQVHPIYMQSMDVYALTHLSMFLTDFGRLPPPTDFPSERYEQSVDDTLSWVLLTGNLDLLAELILCKVNLKSPWSVQQQLAWLALDAAWQDLGFLPAPSFQLTNFLSKNDTERTPYAFRHVYHTTYVAGMLFASLMIHPPRPTEAVMHAIRVNEQRALASDCLCFSRALTEFARTEVDDLPSPVRTDVPPSTATTPAAAATGLLHLFTQRCPDVAPLVADDFDSDLPLDVQSAVIMDGLLTGAARSYDLALLVLILDTIRSCALQPTRTMVVASQFLFDQRLSTGEVGAWFLADGVADRHRDARTYAAAVAAPIELLGYWLAEHAADTAAQAHAAPRC